MPEVSPSASPGMVDRPESVKTVSEEPEVPPAPPPLPPVPPPPPAAVPAAPAVRSRGSVCDLLLLTDMAGEGLCLLELYQNQQ